MQYSQQYLKSDTPRTALFTADLHLLYPAWLSDYKGTKDSVERYFCIELSWSQDLFYRSWWFDLEKEEKRYKEEVLEKKRAKINNIVALCIQTSRLR